MNLFGGSFNLISFSAAFPNRRCERILVLVGTDYERQVISSTAKLCGLTDVKAISSPAIKLFYIFMAIFSSNLLLGDLSRKWVNGVLKLKFYGRVSYIDDGSNTLRLDVEPDLRFAFLKRKVKVHTSFFLTYPNKCYIRKEVLTFIKNIRKLDLNINGTLIMGSCEYDRGTLMIQDILAILNDFSDKTIFYKPHRRETPSLVNAIKNAGFNVVVVETNLPVEFLNLSLCNGIIHFGTTSDFILSELWGRDKVMNFYKILILSNERKQAWSLAFK